MYLEPYTNALASAFATIRPYINNHHHTHETTLLHFDITPPIWNSAGSIHIPTYYRNNIKIVYNTSLFGKVCTLATLYACIYLRREFNAYLCIHVLAKDYPRHHTWALNKPRVHCLRPFSPYAFPSSLTPLYFWTTIYHHRGQKYQTWHKLVIFGGSTEGCSTRLCAPTHHVTTSIDRTPTHPQRIREVSTLSILLSAIHFRAMYVHIVSLVVWAQGEFLSCVKMVIFQHQHPLKLCFRLLECVYLYTNIYAIDPNISTFRTHTRTPSVDVTHVIYENYRIFPASVVCWLLYSCLG